MIIRFNFSLKWALKCRNCYSENKMKKFNHCSSLLFPNYKVIIEYIALQRWMDNAFEVSYDIWMKIYFT